jgi:hypothetical protein
MFVIIFFDKYDEESIVATVGSFETLEEAFERKREILDKIGEYRRATIQRIEKDVPEWYYPSKVKYVEDYR